MLKIAIVGIAISISIMSITVCIVEGFKNEIKSKIVGLSGAIQITNYNYTNSIETNAINLSEEIINTLKSLPNVKSCNGYIIKNGILKSENDNQEILLKGVEKNYNWSFLKKTLIAGNTFSEKSNKEILISNFLSKKLSINVNDSLTVFLITKAKNADDEQISYERRVKRFTVKGIYETGFEDIDSKTAIVSISDLRKINYWQNNEVTGYEINLNDLNKLETSEAEISELLAHTYSVQTIKNIYLSVFSWLSLQDVNSIIIMVLMIIICAVNVISILLILILQKTNLIGFT